MRKNQILKNAIISIVHIIIVSFALFVLYRFLLNTIGVKKLGIWSLVLACTSASQIASLGLSGSVVKFVAKYAAKEEDNNVSDLIQTAVISISIFVGIILILGYPAFKWVLGLVIAGEFYSLAVTILPYSALSLWIMVISSIYQAGLEGLQRIDIKSFLLIGGSIIHLVLCFMLVPKFGLKGVAYSQVIQNSLLLFNNWFFLKRLVPILPVLPNKWNKNIFMEIVGYGINFQIISVTAMLYDPITKAFLSKFGGLTFVGYFEMANRIVQQIRALIISANQVLVASIADLQERRPEKIKEVYKTSYQLTFYLVFPLYSLIIICTPIISETWIGHYERIFVLSTLLLSIGWFFNTLAGPAYFANLGVGELHWNVISHITIALLNAGLGFISGLFFDGIGVVVAWAVALSLGSSLIYLAYHAKHRISFIELIPKESRMIVVVSLICVLLASIIINKLSYRFRIIELNSIIIIIFCIMVFIPFWFNPMRKRLVGWFINELLIKTVSENK